MSYATQADIETRRPGLLAIIASDDAGAIITGAVSEALADAGAEMDAYLAARHDLPLSESLDATPAILERLCVDIAVYRLAARADVAADEHRVRYDDAVKTLEKISKGVISLGLSGNAGEEARPDPVIASSDRVFTRSKTGGIF